MASPPFSGLYDQLWITLQNVGQSIDMIVWDRAPRSRTMDVVAKQDCVPLRMETTTLAIGLVVTSANPRESLNYRDKMMPYKP